MKLIIAISILLSGCSTFHTTADTTALHNKCNLEIDKVWLDTCAEGEADTGSFMDCYQDLMRICKAKGGVL